MEGVEELLVFGKPGEAVPAVNADELERVCLLNEEVRAKFGDQVAIDPRKYGQLTDPGATVYRAMLVGLSRLIVEHADVSKLKDPDEIAGIREIQRLFSGLVVAKPVIDAMAKVSMHWVDFHSQENCALPFDLDELRQLCEAA